MFDTPFDFFALVIAIVAFIFARKAFNQSTALRARLDAIYSDDLHYVHSSGKNDTKTSQIQGITTGNNRYESFDHKDRVFTSAAPGIATCGATDATREGTTSSRGCRGAAAAAACSSAGTWIRCPSAANHGGAARGRAPSAPAAVPGSR